MKVKFRAWHKELKQMFFEVESINFSCDDNHSILLMNLDGRVDLKEIELMQWTGMKDKNGKDIYDGDIIRWQIEGYMMEPQVKGWEHGVGEVRWDDGFYVEGRFVGQTFSLYASNQVMEVVANIHENPELLEQK